MRRAIGRRRDGRPILLAGGGATGPAVGIVNGWLDGMTGWYVQLHSADPGAAGTSNAFTGTVASSRKQATMGSAASGSKAMTSMAAGWVTWDGSAGSIAYVSVWSLSSAGVFQFSAQLTTPRAINAGDTFNLTTLSIGVTGYAA
jgi:hypothetical protein